VKDNSVISVLVWHEVPLLQGARNKTGIPLSHFMQNIQKRIHCPCLE